MGAPAYACFATLSLFDACVFVNVEVSPLADNETNPNSVVDEKEVSSVAQGTNIHPNAMHGLDQNT
jgi:hypothetical protein